MIGCLPVFGSLGIRRKGNGREALGEVVATLADWLAVARDVEKHAAVAFLIEAVVSHELDARQGGLVKQQQFLERIDRALIVQRREIMLKRWMLGVSIVSIVLLSAVVAYASDGMCIVVNGTRYCWGW